MRHAVALKGSSIFRAVPLHLRRPMATPALWLLVAAFALVTTFETALAETKDGICTSFPVYTIRDSSTVMNHEPCHGQQQCASSEEPVRKYCCSGWKRDHHSTEFRCIKIKLTRASGRQAESSVNLRIDADDDAELVRQARNTNNETDASKIDKRPIVSSSSRSNSLSMNSPASGSNDTKQEKAAAQKNTAVTTMAENTKEDTQQLTTKTDPTTVMTSSSISAPQTYSAETKHAGSSAKPIVDSSGRVLQVTPSAETLTTLNTQTESVAGKQKGKAVSQGAQLPPPVAFDSPDTDSRNASDISNMSVIVNHTPPGSTTPNEKPSAKSSDGAVTPNVITLKPTVKDSADAAKGAIHQTAPLTGNDTDHLPAKGDSAEKSTTLSHTAGPASGGATSGDTKTNSASQTTTDPLTLSEAELSHGLHMDTIPVDDNGTESTAIGGSSEPVSGQATGGGAATESGVPDHAATVHISEPKSGPPVTVPSDIAAVVTQKHSVPAATTVTPVPSATGQAIASSIKQTATERGTTQHVYEVHEDAGGNNSTGADRNNSTTHAPPTTSATNCPDASNCSAALAHVSTGQPAADSLSHTQQPAVRASSSASEVTISLLIVTAVVFVLALLWWWSRRRRRQYVGYFGREPSLHFSNPVYDMEALMEQTSFVKLQDAADAEDSDAEGRSRDGTPHPQ